jgi:hypothetical protein
MSRFLHLNFGISGSIFAGVMLHSIKYNPLNNWIHTYAAAAGVVCVVSYILEFVNRNSYGIGRVQKTQSILKMLTEVCLLLKNLKMSKNSLCDNKSSNVILLNNQYIL